MTDDHDDQEDQDEALMAEVRDMLARADAVPPDVVAAAQAAFIWHTIDGELALLTADSALDTEMALVRGVGTPELLTFESPGLTVEVEVATVEIDAGASDPRLRMLGQLVPPQAGDVEVRHAGGTTTVTADDLGRFAAVGIVPGPVSLRCRAGGRAVDTDWFLAQ